MTCSARNGTQFQDRLRPTPDRRSTLMLVSRVAEAALIACTLDYVLLRMVLLELNRRYPQDKPAVLPRSERYER